MNMHWARDQRGFQRESRNMKQPWFPVWCLPVFFSPVQLAPKLHTSYLSLHTWTVVDPEISALDEHQCWAMEDLRASRIRKEKMSELRELNVSDFENYPLPCTLSGSLKHT